ncbi:uncharacterized protein KD926_010508 [Aspergillus affinis]|uniref:uncharacterized protein n=1 Tax=Aspergillus affinis TaxID=1070780 RepID=UPI0022FE8D2E|nr:uncharacterized protein KD926_010508 [Aspergillus affinis]KAI9038668.1 hypothetical protein KD926_010508 [Aspergillus affinis]
MTAPSTKAPAKGSIDPQTLSDPEALTDLSIHVNRIVDSIKIFDLCGNCGFDTAYLNEQLDELVALDAKIKILLQKSKQLKQLNQKLNQLIQMEQDLLVLRDNIKFKDSEINPELVKLCAKL